MTPLLKSVGAVRVFVTDLERSRSFYRDVLKLDERAEDFGWVLFNVGDTVLILAATAPEDNERRLVGRALEVSFCVDDIDAVYRELSAQGVPFDSPPEVQEWGGTLAFCRDPDGNVLTLWG